MWKSWCLLVVIYLVYYNLLVVVTFVVILTDFAFGEIDSQQEVATQKLSNAEVLDIPFLSKKDQQDTKERCVTKDEEEYPFYMRNAPDFSKQDVWPDLHQNLNAKNENNLERTIDAFVNPEHNSQKTSIQEQIKSAQPHFHSGYHTHNQHQLHHGVHEKTIIPSINLNINQNQQAHPSTHFPNTHNYNNFQQNQQLHNSGFNHNNQFHGAHQSQQFFKSVHHGAYNPTHEEFFASQNQKIFRNNPETALVKENLHYNILNFLPTNNNPIPKWTTSRNSDETESSFLQETNPILHLTNNNYESLQNAGRSNLERSSNKNLNFDFVSSPHLSKIFKKKKMRTIFLYPAYNSQYQPYSQGFYRSSDDSKFNSDEIAASPHLYENEKKFLYPIPQYNYQGYERSNVLDNKLVDEIATDSYREASPDPHKFKHKKFKKFPRYPGYYSGYGNLYKAAEHKENDDLSSFTEENLTSPFLFDVPSRIRSEQYKRAVNNYLTSRKVSKRSAIPLTRLIKDPNVKLDIPKTLENFGTATKHAFEDDKAPIYHLKNLIGSSKNAILSALKVAPQNLIIPSRYQIIKDEDSIVGNANSENVPEFPTFSRTFNRLGEIIRDSIKSGQETAEHINNVAYQARNIIHSAKHSTPRLILPYSKIPALEDVRLKKFQKAVLITPRVFDLAEENSIPTETKPDFVKLSHIMDATGFSNPNSTPLDLQKIIIEPHSLTDISVTKTLEKIHNPIEEEEIVGSTVGALENAKVSVGAKNLRDFLLKMKNELSNFAHPKETKTKSKLRLEDKYERKKEIDKFIDTLFDGKTKVNVKRNQNEDEEAVGSGLFLTSDLLHPFMNRASKSELHDYLKDNGDLDDEETPDSLPVEQTKHQENENEAILGAINPVMLERMSGNSDLINKNDGKLERPHIKDPKVGISMTLTDVMLKPFMGALSQDLENPPVNNEQLENGDYLEVPK